MDTYPIHSHSLEKFYYIDGEQLGRHYKEHLSDYRTWDQKAHADKWLLYPQNIGTNISIDETSVSYPRFALNGSLLKYSGACKLAFPGAFGGVDSSCKAISLSNSIRSTIGVS